MGLELLFIGLQFLCQLLPLCGVLARLVSILFKPTDKVQELVDVAIFDIEAVNVQASFLEQPSKLYPSDELSVSVTASVSATLLLPLSLARIRGFHHVHVWLVCHWCLVGGR